MTTKSFPPAPTVVISGIEIRWLPCNRTAAQRKTIYEHLATGNRLTTLYARDEMGIMHPAARVMELRKQGHNIVTNWRIEEDVTGKRHRIAEYVLFARKEPAL